MDVSGESGSAQEVIRDETIRSPAPEFDPPAGERKGWLESVLPAAEFTVLLFYRGFW